MEPKIRIKGFDKDWKSIALGEIASFSKGRGYSKADLCSQGNPIILYGRMYTRYSPILEDVDTYAIPQEGSVYSKGNEVIIPGSGETPEDISIASAVLTPGIILGGDLNILSFDESKHNPAFMAMAITNSKTHKELSGYAQGKTIVHLHNKDIAKGQIVFPELDEQTCIVEYVKSLDLLIRSSVAKLESYKQIKSACLRVLFPHKGEAIPQVRFSGFKKDWKKVRVGELGVWSKGKGLSKNDLKDNGHIKCIHYGELFVLYNEIIEEIRSRTDIQTGCISRVGDILFPDSDVTPTGLARCSVIMEDGVELGGGINVLSITTQDYPPFISYAINLEKEQIVSRVTGTTVRHINASALSEIEICIPDSQDEQQKIASLFHNLDIQIALQKQRLDKLRRINATCLHQMFV